MSSPTVLDKISTAELAALVSSFFRIDNDLTACVFSEAQHIPIAIGRLRLGLSDDQPYTASVEYTEVTRLLIIALATGYVYGRDDGRMGERGDLLTQQCGLEGGHVD